MKVPIKRLKRQATDGERIFTATCVAKDVHLGPEELSQLIHKGRNDPLRKWAEDMNRHFLTQEILMANQHLKRCLTP